MTKRGFSRAVAALSITAATLGIIVPLTLFAYLWMSGFE